MVLVQTLALAVVSMLVRTLSSTLVHQKCHRCQDCKCEDHIHDDDRHRDLKPHVRHYRLKKRERRPQEHVTVSMRDIHQASDWLLDTHEYVPVH